MPRSAILTRCLCGVLCGSLGACSTATTVTEVSGWRDEGALRPGSVVLLSTTTQPAPAKIRLQILAIEPDVLVGRSMASADSDEIRVPLDQITHVERLENHTVRNALLWWFGSALFLAILLSGMVFMPPG